LLKVSDVLISELAKESDETVHYGRITRKGSKIGRTTTVQCGLVAKRYSSYLARFYERIRKRRGTAKALIAVARKLLTIVYYTLKEKRIYTDFATYEFTTA
jgi:transposase